MRLLLPLTLLLCSCQSTVEGDSFLGRPLERLELTGEREAHYQDELKAARARWRADGLEEDAIWVGRHLAYLGQYQNAIDWYTDRIEDFPRSAKLLRHRGHRYLSTRRTDDAVADFTRAWELVEGSPDEVEPDGAPNALGIPRSTLQTNILYHLGLAYWIRGDFEDAERAWRSCNELSPNDDSLVSSLNWHVHALRRLGREDEAFAALDAVQSDMDVIENHAYHRILLLQKGLLSERDVLFPDGEEDGVQDATSAYGVSLWHLANDEREVAETMWRRIVEETPWNAFGHLGAEAELAR